MASPQVPAFTTPLTLMGPARKPAQMLADQSYDGHASVHNGDMAESLGLTGAPIEGPTHFSQFDPLAATLWGDAWFERGCISAHFLNMVVGGEEVTASATTTGPDRATIAAAKPDGTPVLTGTITLGPDAQTEIDERRSRDRPAGDLFIVDVLTVGQTIDEPVTSSVDADTDNGSLYPFSLAQKLSRITESSGYYASTENPWGRAILPMEMLSVLTQKGRPSLRPRGPAVGLFLDLEVKLLAGPVFVGHEYALRREVIALGQTRRVESHMVRTSVIDPDTGVTVAEVILNSGVFKDSYAGYPAS